MKSLFRAWLIASIAWVAYIIFFDFNEQQVMSASDDNWIDLLAAILLPPALLFLVGSVAARLVRRLQHLSSSGQPK
jgi:hypothetical protein